MGLDITAYRNLEKIENPELDKYGELVNRDSEWQTPDLSVKWAEKHFPGRSEGVELDTVYKYGEKFSFPAGSYSGYNKWRSTLEIFVKDNSFYELINFADNEGVIGSVVATKLYDDFAKNEERAKEYAKGFEDGDWWIEKYLDWKKAFFLASKNGAVQFH